MMITDQIRQHLRIAKSHGGKLAQIAVKAGLHKNALYGFEAEDWNPKANTINALSRYFDGAGR